MLAGNSGIAAAIVENINAELDKNAEIQQLIIRKEITKANKREEVKMPGARTDA